MRVFHALIVALALALPGPALAQAPAAPVLLAADPALSGPYEGTVLLVVPSGTDTHFGFILNRPTTTQVAEVLPEVPSAARVDLPVFFGGPFLRDTLFALARSPHPPAEDTLEVLPGVYMAHGREAAARVAAHAPARARFYAGVVIWQRGELEAELASRHWVIAEPDVELIVGGSADTLWQRVLERLQTMVALR